MNRNASWPCRALPAVSAILLVACGSDTDQVTAPATAPVVVATPTPAPAPTAQAFVCPLAALPDHGDCPKLTPVFRDPVNAAIDTAVAEHPELFDLNDNLGGGSYRIKDRDKYLKAVTANLNKQGFCVAESKEELGIKNTNTFNEQWNVVTSDLRVRRSYITTCFPAAF
jgi:hypothetical protein